MSLREARIITPTLVQLDYHPDVVVITGTELGIVSEPTRGHVAGEPQF